MVIRITQKSKDSFERNRRRRFEMRMRPVADKLYWEILPGIIAVDRRYRESTSLSLYSQLDELDKKWGIDVFFTLNNGMRLTCQEKFGSPEFTHLKDVTVEHRNDPLRGIPGDWFTMIAQLYFFGFASKDYKSFDLWVLLDWPRTVWETIKGNINWELMTQSRIRNIDGAKADFMRTFMAKLPGSCILRASFKESS